MLKCLDRMASTYFFICGGGGGRWVDMAMLAYNVVKLVNSRFDKLVYRLLTHFQSMSQNLSMFTVPCERPQREMSGRC